MAGYFGTGLQQQLQKLAEDRYHEVEATPGAFHAGRMMGCDDIDLLGWDALDAILERDNVCGFRLIDAERTGEIRSKLALRGYRLDTWDAFVGSRDSVLASCEPVEAQPLPKGLAHVPVRTEPEGNEVRSIQALMGSAGVTPFSGSFLAGEIGRGRTVAIRDASGEIAAAGHCYLPHSAQSARAGYAWGGLVAVAERHRGKGLGRQINARMAIAAFHELGATHLYELVSATNIPSRRMVAACGLRHDPGLLCGVASPTDGARFTR